MRSWIRGDLEVRWLGGGLALRWGTEVWLLDVPVGTLRELGPWLPKVRGVLLTSDRTRGVAGLVGLLCGLSEVRAADDPLQLLFPLGCERGVQLAEAWVRSWPNRFPVVMDGVPPSQELELGLFPTRLAPVASAELNAQTGQVESLRAAVAARVETPSGAVVWAPSSKPSQALRMLCDGAALVAAEHGAVPWPNSRGRLRSTVAEAISNSGTPEELWLFGDDGRPWHGALA